MTTIITAALTEQGFTAFYECRRVAFIEETLHVELGLKVQHCNVQYNNVATCGLTGTGCTDEELPQKSSSTNEQAERVKH